MRKIVIYTLFLLIAACLAGCGPVPESEPVPTATMATETAVQPTVSGARPSATAAKTTETPVSSLEIQAEDLEGVEIEFWHPWIGAQEAAMLALVEQFNAENPVGVLVQVESRSGDLYRDLWAGLNSGSYPTVVAASSSYLRYWSRAGDFVTDLEPYLGDPLWGLSAEDMSDFYPAPWAQDEHQGVRLGVPATRSTNLLFYNQTWAEELGFDSPPTTPAEFKRQACAGAAATPESLTNPGVGGWIAGGDPAVVMSWMLAFGADGKNENGEGYDFTNPQVEAAFDFIHSLFNSGCAWIPEEPTPNAVFAERGGLFYSSSLGGLSAQLAAFEASESQDEWTVLPYPTKAGEAVIDLYGPSYALLRATPRQQLAGWVFIRWLLSPENQAAISSAGGSFPASQSGAAAMEAYGDAPPQWEAAIDLLPYGRSEPGFGSWRVGRWALSDAFLTLTGPEFSDADIPLLLAEVEGLLGEIEGR